MIEISIINLKNTLGFSCLSVNGHSDCSALCNSISGFMKLMEHGCALAGIEYNVNYPVEGKFELQFTVNDKFEYLITVFKRTILWLIDKYPNEIKFNEVN